MIQNRHLERLSLLCPTQVEPQAALEEVLNEVWSLGVLRDWARVNGRWWRPMLNGVVEVHEPRFMTANTVRVFRGRWAMLEAAEWIVDNMPDMCHWRESR